MSRFAAIDLSRLPAPDVVETLSFESILRAMKDDFAARHPGFDAWLESDPAIKLMEAAAYRELLIRQRVNDAARSVMPAFAAGADLDHLAAFYGVERQALDPGDPDALPPIPPTREADGDLRRRVQMAPEAMTTAGAAGSYVFNALSAGETPATIDVASPEPGRIVVTHVFDPNGFSAKVKDATAVSPAPGNVVVTVLGRDGNGAPDRATLDAVRTRLSGDRVRPLGDRLTVRAAAIVDYRVEAVLYPCDGPDVEVVKAEAERRFWRYAADQHVLGGAVARSGIDAALHVPGARKVEPVGWRDIETDEAHAPYCVGLDLRVAETAPPRAEETP